MTSLCGTRLNVNYTEGEKKTTDSKLLKYIQKYRLPRLWHNTERGGLLLIRPTNVSGLLKYPAYYCIRPTTVP